MMGSVLEHARCRNDGTCHKSHVCIPYLTLLVVDMDHWKRVDHLEAGNWTLALRTKSLVVQFRNRIGVPNTNDIP